MIADVFARGGLSIDRLRAFLSVAEAGGIARAAPRDPTRQSLLSRQIGELEAFFETPLVERRGRTIAVTKAGEHLAIVVREMIDGIRDVAVMAHEPALAVDVTLGAGDSVLHGWVLPRIGRALAAAPRATLSLVTLAGSDVKGRLLDARLDFGVLRANELASGLRSRPIGNIEYALYVPRALRPKRRPSSDAELIASLPLAVQYGDPELDRHLRSSTARAGIALSPRLVCETFPQAERAMRSGRFAAVLPRLEDPPPGTDVVRSPLFGLRAKMVLAWHGRLERRRPRVAAMSDVLASALART